MAHPLDRLRHHVTGAIERGEAEPVTARLDPPTLTVEFGCLHLFGTLLMQVYDAGDCDTCPWPMVSEFRTPEQLRKRLAHALYDAREMGPGHFDAVLLPDGERFTFDALVS